MALDTKFLTGFEHGLANAQVSGGPGASLFSSISGAATVQTTNKRGNGAYCGRVAVGAASFAFFNLITITGTKIVGRLAVRAETLPSSETTIVDLIPSAGTQAFIYVNGSGDIRAGWSTDIKAGPAGAITTGAYTLIEFQIDVANGTFDWKVNGSAQTQSTGGSTTGTTVAVRLGRNAASGAAFTMLYDDVILGTWTTSGDWYGDGEVLWLPLNADGTHSFTANDFSTGDAGTQRASSYVDFHLMTDDALPWTTTRSTTDNVAQRVIRTTGYVELAPAAADVDGTKPTANAVRALAGVSSSSTSQTNTARCYGHNGGGDNAGVSSVNLVGTNGAPVDISVAAMEFATGIIPLPGSGWTEAGIEGARLRFGHSGDISPVPTLQVAGFEVDYPMAGGTAWDPGTIADALGVADAIDVSVGRAVSPADALGVTDARVFDRGLVQADAVGLTDSAASAGVFARTIDDALGIADSVAAGLARSQDVNDALGIVDSLQPAVGFAVTPADALGVTDAVALARALALADALGVIDSAAPIILKAVQVDDALGIVDQTSFVIGYSLSVGDVLAITDALASLAVLQRTIADALAITDSVSALILILKQLDDALGITDTLASQAAFIRAIDDLLGLTDAASPAVAYQRNVADALGVTDSADGLVGRAATIDDVLNITDASALIAAYERSVDDQVVIADLAAPLFMPFRVTPALPPLGIHIGGIQPESLRTGRYEF